jgi:hypothetical protein
MSPRPPRPIADLLADNPYPLRPEAATLIAARLRDYGVPWSEAAALVRRLPAEAEPALRLRGEKYGEEGGA